jgi:hypothetical protein
VTVHEQLAELRRVLEGARSMPMSASAVFNRAEVLAILDRLSEAVDSELAGAKEVVSARDELVSGGRTEAELLVAEARDEQERLASETEVSRSGREQADARLAEAREQAAAIRREADDYADTKLANFEVTLQRTLESVRLGRRRLAGEGELDALAVDDVDEIKLPGHLEG